jgi:hypothetical protein
MRLDTDANAGTAVISLTSINTISTTLLTGVLSMSNPKQDEDLWSTIIFLLWIFGFLAWPLKFIFGDH